MRAAASALATLAPGVALSVMALAAAAGPAVPPLSYCAVWDCEPGPEAYAWQGDSREEHVTFPSARTGARLHGHLFAPMPADAKAGEHPAIVIVPGSSGLVREWHYRWAARALAGEGYVALAVDPQGIGASETFGAQGCGAEPPEPCPGVPYQDFDNFLDAAASSVDYLLGGGHPFAALVDGSRVGAAGHSLGARAVSGLQGADARVGAVVAWDNLASNPEGDEGSASGGPPVSSLLGGQAPGSSPDVKPRAPAMGQASDAQGFSLNTDPDKKKTAYNRWRAHGVPSMEVVFRDVAHGAWAQTFDASESDLHRFAYYTRAWFDLWLREDPSARDRLLAEEVMGTPREEVLSERWRSAAFLPAWGVDCPDLGLC